MIDNHLVKQFYPDAEGLMIEPMLIHKATSPQLKAACNHGEFFGQLKKDGAFYQFVKGHTGQNFLFGRTISQKTGVLTEKSDNVPHITKALRVLPNETILIGEIYYPKTSVKSTVEIMGCLPDKAIARQQGSYGFIHYYIHDILMYDGIDFLKAEVDNWTRYQILQKIFYLYGLDQYNYLELAESWEDNLYERIGEALAQGEEGMVLKKKTALYIPGKRPDTNLKAKKVDFIDAIIIGFEYPTKEYYGKDIENWQYWINSQTEEVLPIGFHYQEPKAQAVTKAFYMNWSHSRIKIGAFNENGQIQEIGVVHSGISDEMKQDMSEHPDNYLKHVVKIQMMEKDKKAQTIRHGFFRGMHETKDPSDCTIKSIF